MKDVFGRGNGFYSLFYIFTEGCMIDSLMKGTGEGMDGMVGV